jgi:hypothetical protein
MRREAVATLPQARQHLQSRRNIGGIDFGSHVQHNQHHIFFHYCLLDVFATRFFDRFGSLFNFELVRDWLGSEHGGRWLMVVDDADDRHLLQP